MTTHKSKLNHTKAIAERVELGITDALGITHPSQTIPISSKSDTNHSNQNTTNNNSHDPNSSKQNKQTSIPSNSNPVKFVIRIHHDQVQISMDTSHTPLHQRGYRLQPGKAPLREDLAYALLKSVGWPPSKPQFSNHSSTSTSSSIQKHEAFAFLDPFCGSGTVAIEAAAMSHQPKPLPPGRLRHVPLQNTALEKESLWNYLIRRHVIIANTNTNTNTDTDSNTKTDTNHNIMQPKLLLMASDRDKGAIEIAKSNAKRAGVSQMIQFQHCAVSSSPLLQQTNNQLFLSQYHSLFLVTNPPFGKRISPIFDFDNHTGIGTGSGTGTGGSSSPLLPLYQKLGHQLNQLNNPIIGMIAKDSHLARRMGLKQHLNVSFVTQHGGLTIAALTNK